MQEKKFYCSQSIVTLALKKIFARKIMALKNTAMFLLRKIDAKDGMLYPLL